MCTLIIDAIMHYRERSLLIVNSLWMIMQSLIKWLHESRSSSHIMLAVVRSALLRMNRRHIIVRQLYSHHGA